VRRGDDGWIWLLLLLALGKRRATSSPAPWSPMGPFPPDQTLPRQDTLPPNPLDRR